MPSAKKKRRTIDKNIRNIVWKRHNGNSLEGKCYVCNETITYDNFDIGHDIAVANGGTDDISNLRPLCRPCNACMGTMNIEEYRNKHFKSQSQTYISPVAPTASIVVSNNPYTQVELKIQHKGGDTLKAGEWKLSIVPVGSPPDFIISSSNFSIGNEIFATTTTKHATDLTNVFLTGVIPFSAGAKYDVKLIHIPSDALLLDTVVQIRS